ncbi:uncharacterized protein LOC144100566 isoform X2 [Amblyomma americanum]
MRKTVKTLWWLLASVGVICGANNNKKPTKETVKKGSGDPYWCGPKLEQVCYEGDSNEEKGWNVDENHEDTHEKKPHRGAEIAEKQTTVEPSPSTTSNTRSGNPACSLDFDSGPCFSSKPMYYYRKDSKKCEMFVYGGCGGNKNRFKTRKACQEACGHQ